MSVEITLLGASLTGDGYGMNGARNQIDAAPANAKRMLFAYKAHMLGDITDKAYWTGKDWESMQFFGLGWTNEMYVLAAETDATRDFFGIANTGEPYYSITGGGGNQYNHTYKILDYAESGDGENIAAPWGRGYYLLSGTTQIFGQQVGFFRGMEDQAVLVSVDNIAGNTKTGTTLVAADQILSFPLGATAGAECTFLWEVWGSPIDKTVYCRMVKDRNNLQGDDMFTAMDGKTEGTARDQIRKFTIHADVASVWRNADDSMNFPRWLKMQYSLHDYSLVLSEYRVQFFDESDNPLL